MRAPILALAAALSAAPAGARSPRPADRQPAAVPATAGAQTPRPADSRQGAAPATAEAAPAVPKALDVGALPFERESIQRVVAHHMPRVIECYEKVLDQSGTKVEGRVMLAFTINPEGMVSQAAVLPKKSTLKDERIESCVLAVRGWLFPKPPDNRDYPIEYPFDLKVSR